MIGRGSNQAIATAVFVALLSCSRGAHGYVAIVNKADHSEIHVVPTPGKVGIDADLGDWDLSGAIDLFIDEASRETHSARLAMMYDEDFLYLGGRVKDPTPLRNAHSFAGDPGMAWNADAIQVRFLANPDLKSSASLMSGGRMPPEEQQFVNHVTLWHSTSDDRPGYHASYTLNFKDPTLNPAGVVAAYKKDADDKGYTFEYRIPWKVLRAPRPLRAGDEVQAQFQVHWGNDMGTSVRVGMTDLRKAASGDLGYMGPGSWGKAVIEKAGNLKRTEKAAAGRAAGHVPVSFTLEKAGKVSLAICDSQGRLVRTGLGAQPFAAGEQVWAWDGLDDADRPVPAGRYTVKLLAHDGIGQKLVCDIGISGTPPHQTEDGTGGWAGDYRFPQTMGIEGDHVILGTASAEAAAATICTDLEGRKRFGTAGVGHAVALHRGHAYLLGAGNAMLTKFALETGRFVPFASGRAEVVLTAKRPDETPQDWNTRCWQLHAVAVAGERIVVSSRHDDRLLLFDLATGEPKGEAPVDKPGGLAIGPKGELYVVSGKRLGRYDLATQRFDPLTDELDAPQHVACDAEGHAYVSLQGKTMQVWKFSPTGKVLQKYGLQGGRPLLGKFAVGGMLKPYGIAVDKHGRLWVAEADERPKRYSVWNPDGTLWKEFFGSIDYSTQAVVDPQNPQRVYMQGVRYLVDYERNTWQVDATLIRGGEDDGVVLGAQGNHSGGSVAIVEGRTFLWTGSTLYEFSDTAAVPRMSIFKGKRMETPVGKNGKPGKPREVKVMQAWIDANNDGRVQAKEKRDCPGVPGYYLGLPMDGGLNFLWARGNHWASQGGAKTTAPYSVVRWKFLGFNDRGGLTYGDPDKPEVVATDEAGGACDMPMPGPDGSIYMLVSGGSLDRGVRAQGSGHRLVKFSRQGKKLWEYHNVHCAFAWTSDPYTPGYVVSAYGVRSPLEDLVMVTGYYGQYFLLDAKDGLFLDALGQDQRSPYTLDEAMVLTENFNGTLFRHPQTGKTYALGGDCDQRLWELTGLDTAKRWTQTLTLGPADVVKAQAAARNSLAARSGAVGRATATIPRLNADAAGGVADWQAVPALPIYEQGKRTARVRLGYDERHLLARFEVADESPLVNTPTDQRLLFKTGDSVEINLATDKGSRSVRGDAQEEMRRGDTRLIMARTAAGQVVATRYR